MQDAKKVASYKLRDARCEMQDKKQVSSYELRKDKESCKVQMQGVTQSASLPVYRSRINTNTKKRYKYKLQVFK